MLLGVFKRVSELQRRGRESFLFLFRSKLEWDQNEDLLSQRLLVLAVQLSQSKGWVVSRRVHRCVQRV